MINLIFSTSAHSAASLTQLQRSLEQFEALSRIHVDLRVRTEADERGALVQSALRGTLPDVSEIGTSWVTDFTSMNTLRPFSPADLMPIGKPEDFVPALWQTTQLHQDPQIWAIPWVGTSLAIHYRRDLFEQAGIDETQAFQSHASLGDAVARLSVAGVPIPCQMPLWYMTASVHFMASWIWAAGSDFCTPDGKQVRFAEPVALRAIRSYLKNLEYITPDGWQIIHEGKLDRWFDRGVCAMYFGAPAAAPRPLPDYWGLADFPVEHFVGGGNLVISRNTRHEAEALQLVRFLVNQETVIPFGLADGSFPPRPGLLVNEVYQQDAVLRFATRSVFTGRTYRPVPLWGLIEQRLAETIHRISTRYAEDQTTDLDHLIEHEVPLTANRLNLSLQR